MRTCHHKVTKQSMGRFVQLSIMYNTNPQKQPEMRQFLLKQLSLSTLDMKSLSIKCVVYIMFGIANKYYVIRPDSNSYLV